MGQAMDQLRRLQKTMYAYNYAAAVIELDESTVAPGAGGEGRREALDVLEGVRYQLIADPQLPRLLDEAEQEELDEQAAAEVRELRRQNDQFTKIPAEEYAKGMRMLNECREAWLKGKATRDFSIYAPLLEQCVDNRIRWANYFAPGKDPMATWLDLGQEGLTVEEVDSFFAALREAIVPLLRRILTEGKAPRSDFLDGPWPIDKQEELSKYLMSLLKLDPDHCCLAESEHPFTLQLYDDDVRITTHYYTKDLTSSMFSVIHEGGHALYELNISPKLRYTVLAGGSCAGLHESQSRLFENFVGRSRGFVRYLWPKLLELFPDKLAGVTCEEFYRALNRVQPSLIRTEADELTYSLHVMVRYELEKMLFSGQLKVKDLPQAWNRLYKEYLGVDVPDDTQGVMQDIHWSMGSFGQFQGYAMGTAYAAQMVEYMKEHFDFDGCCERADLQPILDFQREHLWQYGMMRTPDVLIRQACGGDFDPNCVVRYLTKKYSEIYELD